MYFRNWFDFFVKPQPPRNMSGSTIKTRIKKANQYNKHYIHIACGSQELVIYDKTSQSI